MYIYVYIYILDILFVCFPGGLSKWKGVWGTSRVPKFRFVGPLKVAILLPTSPSPALHQPFTPPTACVFFEGTPFFRVVFFKGTPQKGRPGLFFLGFPWQFLGYSASYSMSLLPVISHLRSPMRPTQNANPQHGRSPRPGALGLGADPGEARCEAAGAWSFFFGRNRRLGWIGQWVPALLFSVAQWHLIFVLSLPH